MLQEALGCAKFVCSATGSRGRIRLPNTCSIVVGLYFIGIIVYLLLNAVVPITKAGEWRTIIDVAAVSTYLIGGIPMVLIALQDLGVIHKDFSDNKKLGYHAIYVAVFLVFAHVAMIAGMVDPALLGYQGESSMHHTTFESPMKNGEMPVNASQMNSDHGSMHK